MRLPPIDRQVLTQRLGIWGVVVAGHALVACALCWQAAAPAQPPAGDHGQMVAVSLVSSMEPAGPMAKARPRPAEPSHKPNPPALVDGLMPSAETTEAKPETASLTVAEMELVSRFQLASMGEPGTACDLTGQLAEAFGSSPEVRQGIAAIPANGRSVANAVMLWDGHWARDTQTGGMALLRALLVKAVVSSRPECLLAQNHGPVLFLIPDNHTTVVLAIGSGQWRWADVVAPSSPPDVIASVF